MRRRIYHLGMFGPSVTDGVSWEIDHHLEERIEELMATGLTREQAESEARETFGDMDRVRRELLQLDRTRERKVRVGQTMEAIWQDVRFAVRAMRKNVGFTAAVVLTLGLGIGANAAMFNVVDALLLRPLPYANPTELYETRVMFGDGGGMPYIEWDVARAWQKKATFAQSILLHQRTNVLFTGGTEAVTLPVEGVTPEFEKTIGIRPFMGRLFTNEDAKAGAPNVVVLDYGFWQTQLGGDAGVLGRTLELEGVPHTVIGVMPRGFKFPEYSTTSFWVALRDDGTLLGKPESMVYVLARVDASHQPTSSAQAGALGRALLQAKDPSTKQFLDLATLQSTRASNKSLREPMWMLCGAVALILLVAGFNMINLLLVRAAARTRELAVRMAIGASRARIIRQLMTESMVMSLLSGVVAVVLAVIALHAMQSIMPESITFFSPYEIGMEKRGLLFTFLVAALSGLAFGIIPALRAVRRNTPATEAGLTNYGGRGRAGMRLRRGLVVCEAAISVTLLIGAFLLIHSFMQLMRVDPGFEPRSLAMMKLEVSSARHGDAAERSVYLDRLQQSIGAIPGVTGVTISNGLPPHVNISFGLVLEAEGHAAPKTGQPMILPFANVQPDFFEVTGARLLAGRTFEQGDDVANNVIIDTDLARFLWVDGAVVGKRFRTGPEDTWLTVVGVMKDLKLMGPDARQGDFTMLRSLKPTAGGYLGVAVRTRGNVNALLPEIRKAVRAIDKDQPIQEIASASEMYGESVDMPRFLVVVMGSLGGIALVLAALGLFGVLAFGVAQRSHEMAVRIALGAPPRHVRGLVIREGMLMAITGIAIGIAGAYWLSKIIDSALYTVQSRDPITYVIVAITMMLVTLVACWHPARRATRIAPAVAMRVN